MFAHARCLPIFLLLSSGAAFAQEKEAIVHGTIRSIDKDNGTITVLSGSAKAHLKTLNLHKMDLPVTHPLSKPLKLTDLSPNRRVALKVIGEDDVVSIQDESDTDWGLIVSISADEKIISARLGHALRQIEVGPDLAIFVDGERATVKNLKLNAYINVCVSPDRRRVVQLRQGKGITIGYPYGKYLLHTGFLINKDDVNKKATIVALGERYEKQDYLYDAWTAVRLSHSSYSLRQCSMDDIKGPCRVYFYYESDRLRLSSLSVDIPLIGRRPVVKFDQAAKRLTVALDDEQRTEEFPIATDALILREGQPIGLDWLKEKRLVTLGLSLDQKEVVFLQCLEK